MDIVLLLILTGISYGMVLFLIAAGLTLTLGLMGVVNLTHGIIFVSGGIVGLSVAAGTGSFILGILAGGAASGVIGLLIERGFLRLLHGRPLEQILVTFGFIYIITNILLWIFGPWAKPAFVPSYFAGSVSILGIPFPLHRLWTIVIGAALCLGLWWLQEKTRIGAIIRAGMDDKEMASGMGINLTPVNIATFFLGSFLAGAGCVLGAQLLGSISFADGIHYLLLAIVVVIIGGVGSVQGALVGALLIGIINTFGVVYAPLITQYTTYILMVLVLFFRPSGLLGRKL